MIGHTLPECIRHGESCLLQPEHLRGGIKLEGAVVLRLHSGCVHGVNEKTCIIRFFKEAGALSVVLKQNDSADQLVKRETLTSPAASVLGSVVFGTKVSPVLDAVCSIMPMSSAGHVFEMLHYSLQSQQRPRCPFCVFWVCACA